MVYRGRTTFPCWWPWGTRCLNGTPDWPTGIAIGVGGLAGAYTGARIQSRLPELLIRRVMAALVVAIGVRYLIAGLI
jgi:uncharacterized membrane protein YfcA